MCVRGMRREERRRRRTLIRTSSNDNLAININLPSLLPARAQLMIEKLAAKPTTQCIPEPYAAFGDGIVVGLDVVYGELGCFLHEVGGRPVHVALAEV